MMRPVTRLTLAVAVLLSVAQPVDEGSGYCSQNAMPAHVGIPSVWIKNVDVEVVAIVGGQRRIVSVQLVKFEEHKRTPLRIQAT